MSLSTHPKKRIEIIIEAPVAGRLLDLLDGLAVTGYTVLPALAGRGHDGTWHRDDSFNNASHMVCIVCILDEQKSHAVLDAVYPVVSRQIGIVSISDVEVVRRDHF